MSENQTDTMKHKIDDALALMLVHIPPEVPSDKYNDHRRYHYASLEAVMAHIRPAMIKHGFTISASETDFTVIDPAKPFVQATFQFWLNYQGQGTQPESITQTTVIQNDPSIGKLKTYAMKSWLMTKFMLVNGPAVQGAQTQAKASPNWENRRQGTMRAAQPAPQAQPKPTPKPAPAKAAPSNAQREAAANFAKLGFTKGDAVIPKILAFMAGKPDTPIKELADKDWTTVSSWARKLSTHPDAKGFLTNYYSNGSHSISECFELANDDDNLPF